MEIAVNIDKVVCVGKNYKEHALELGDNIPEKPVIFLKPASTIKQANHWQDTIEATLPINHGDVHYECEIALQIAQDCFQLTISQAEKAINAVSLGLDMTLRQLQSTLKKNGHPWTISKVFQDAAILGPWIPYHSFTDYLNSEYTFHLNKQLKQHAYGREMIMNPTELLIYISKYFPLRKGDIIFTGTPAGVGAIHSGDIARLCWMDKYFEVKWK